MLQTITDVETTEQAQVIDDLVTRTENAIDAGGELRFNVETNSSARKYEKASSRLEEAMRLATDLMPDRFEEIRQQSRRARVRQQSLGCSERHRSIHELVVTAQDHADAGNMAFHESEYELAQNKY